MPLTGHTSVRQGKRVLVHMRNGDTKILKFKQHRARVVEFYDGEPIAADEIRTLSIFKGSTQS